MSCINGTGPINISLTDITNKCDYKCAYSFNYNNSTCVATHNDNYISLGYDNQSAPPVLYNSAGYNVKEIRIYTPSLHSYFGNKTDGEIIIVHNCVTGARPLLVCIPIRLNGSSNEGSNILSSIVSAMVKNAPSEGESTTVNVSRFNLNSFVPRKPYYSYSATEPYQPCSANVDYVVFDSSDAINISAETLQQFRSIIQQNVYDVKSGPLLFYNEKGPSQGNASGDEIYIDCQPVGHSDEQTTVITQQSTPVTYYDLLQNPFLMGIIFILLIFFVLYATKKVLDMFKPSRGGSIQGGSIYNI
jgi:carbonic anhydrase